MPTPAYPRYLRLATGFLLAAAAVFVLLPYVLRLYDPAVGSFGVDTLNALAFGAVMVATILHLGFLAYSRVFPQFKAYQEESLEGDGKLFENLTSGLETDLLELKALTDHRDRLPVLIENRKTAQFKFLIRCVRLSFCLVSLYALVALVEHVLTAALTVVPK